MNIIIDCGHLDYMSKTASEKLNIQRVPTLVGKFNCGETRIQIQRSIRGKYVFIFQGFTQAVNDDFMALCATISAAKSASAKEVTVVAPYLCYSRQERKTKPREPITAQLVAAMLKTAGADRVITIDLHAPAIQGFYGVLDNLYSIAVFKDYIRDNIIKNREETVIVAPDFGAAKMARKYKETLGTEVVIIEKARSQPGKSNVVQLYGDDITGKDCIILDDMIDTGGTVCNASTFLKERGARSVHLVVTHPVLSGNAVENLSGSDFDSIHVGNTINQYDRVRNISKINVVDFSQLITEAIRRIINSESISDLF
jgi:ribose-phosphate pyrophosphokinase